MARRREEKATEAVAINKPRKDVRPIATNFMPKKRKAKKAKRK